MYPCVILSRCFWQHTSKTHTERALIAHRWTQVSTLYVSSCESFTRFWTGPRDVAAPLKRSQDAELCNECEEDGWEEDGHRRRDARSSRGEKRLRSHLPNHSAYALLLPGNITRRPERICPTFGDTVRRRTGSQWFASIAPACRRSGSAGISPCLRARRHGSNARVLRGN